MPNSCQPIYQRISISDDTKKLLPLDDYVKFSLLHNNVRSLRHNLKDLQVYLLDELGHHFSVIGISETKITKTSLLDFYPSLSGYEFPMPLVAGGVGMYIFFLRTKPSI